MIFLLRFQNKNRANEMSNITQSLKHFPTAPPMPVTLADIEKPDARMKRLNNELHNLQIELINSKKNGKTHQERKELKRKCQELDKELDNAHNEYQDYLSESIAGSCGIQTPRSSNDHIIPPAQNPNASIPPPYESEVEHAKIDVDIAEKALIEAFNCLGIDSSTILDEVRVHPSDYVNDTRPVVKRLADAIQTYNKATITEIHCTASSSLKNLREYFDYRIDELVGQVDESIVNKSDAIALRISIVENERLLDKQKLLRLEKIVNMMARHLMPITIGRYSIAIRQLLIGETTEFDALDTPRQMTSFQHSPQHSYTFIQAAIFSKNANVVEHVLKQMVHDKKLTPNGDIYTLIEANDFKTAAEYGDVETVKLLVEYGVPLGESGIPNTKKGLETRDFLSSIGIRSHMNLTGITPSDVMDLTDLNPPDIMERH